jgi:hypothetical protein
MAWDTNRILGVGAMLGIAVGGFVGYASLRFPGLIFGMLVGPLAVWLVLRGPAVLWAFLQRWWWAVLLAALGAGVYWLVAPR